MSLKPIPGLGKSGISLMRSFSPATSYSMLTSVLRTAGQPMPPWSEGLAAGWVPRKSACSLQLGVLPATRRAPRNSARSPQLGARSPHPGVLRSTSVRHEPKLQPADTEKNRPTPRKADYAEKGQS